MTTTRAELRTLAGRASAGPWKRYPASSYDPRDPRDLPLSSVVFEQPAGGHQYVAAEVARDNANYIAAVSPDDVIALLDRIDELETVAKHARAVISLQISGTHEANLRNAEVWDYADAQGVAAAVREANMRATERIAHVLWDAHGASPLNVKSLIQTQYEKGDPAPPDMIDIIFGAGADDAFTKALKASDVDAGLRRMGVPLVRLSPAERVKIRTRSTDPVRHKVLDALDESEAKRLEERVAVEKFVAQLEAKHAAEAEELTRIRGERDAAWRLEIATSTEFAPFNHGLRFHDHHPRLADVAICHGDTPKVIGANVIAAMKCSLTVTAKLRAAKAGAPVGPIAAPVVCEHCGHEIVGHHLTLPWCTQCKRRVEGTNGALSPELQAKNDAYIAAAQIAVLTKERDELNTMLVDVQSQYRRSSESPLRALTERLKVVEAGRDELAKDRDKWQAAVTGCTWKAEATELRTEKERLEKALNIERSKRETAVRRAWSMRNGGPAYVAQVRRANRAEKALAEFRHHVAEAAIDVTEVMKAVLKVGRKP